MTALSDFTIEDVTDAFHQNLRGSKKFPTPAEIVEIARGMKKLRLSKERPKVTILPRIEGRKKNTVEWHGISPDSFNSNLEYWLPKISDHLKTLETAEKVDNYLLYLRNHCGYKIQ